MGDDLATANVNRSYSLAATSIAIFTFMLAFLYPRFASGEINAFLFQAALVVMGVATFSFVFSSFYYYCSSLGSRIDDAERALYSRRGDRFWLLGCILLFLDPSLILFSVGLLAVGRVVRTLAGVPTLRDPLLPTDPDRTEEFLVEVKSLRLGTSAPCWVDSSAAQHREESRHAAERPELPPVPCASLRSSHADRGRAGVASDPES